jgi:hypothetical protein
MGFASLRRALVVASRPEMLRDRIVSYLEAGRLQTVVLFVERVRNRNNPNAVLSAFPMAAAVEYLDQAFELLPTKVENATLQMKWLSAIGEQIVAYAALVMVVNGVYQGPQPRSDELASALRSDDDGRIARVVSAFERCQQHGELRRRIEQFQSGYQEAVLELSQVSARRLV